MKEELLIDAHKLVLRQSDIFSKNFSEELIN
jgi:hypothetical protein